MGSFIKIRSIIRRKLLVPFRDRIKERVKCTSNYFSSMYHQYYYYYGVANIPVAMIGFVINCLALYCLWKSSRGLKLSSANRFLLALNLWDTFTCLFLVPARCIYYMTAEHLHYDKPPIIKYIGSINTWCSTFFITLVALNRYLAVSRPFSHQAILTRRRVAILLMSAVGIGLLIPTLIIIYLPLFGSLSMMFCVLELCVIITFYCLILRTVNNSSVAVRSMRRNEDRIPRRQRQISWNVVILLTAYITCSCCHYGFILRHIINKTPQTQIDIDIGVLIYNMNSLCNPVIYVLRSSSYRDVLKNLFGLRRRTVRNRVRRNRIAILEPRQPLPVTRVAEARKDWETRTMFRRYCSVSLQCNFRYWF